jgi:hypothetical protein
MLVFNIIICALLFAVFLALFLPTGKLVKKLLDIDVNRITVSFVILLTIGGAIIYKAGLAGIIYLALSAFCLWAFIFGFLVDRKYPYTLAIVFLAVCPFLLIAKLDSVAEFSAVLCYLCLVLGVLKDIFYNKIVDGGSND